MLHHSFNVIFSLLLFLLCHPVLCFFPTTWKEVVFGNGGTSHVQITKTAFANRAMAYFPSLTTLSSRMRHARDEMADANADVDDIQDIAHYHCDGESFPLAQARIQTLKSAAINALLSTSPDVAMARSSIGQALHTIQDFYAHSNWVELENSSPNSDLIRNNDMSSYSAKFTDPTCNSCSDVVPPPFYDYSVPLPCGGFDCSSNTNGFTSLTSGYYFGEDSPPAGVPIPSNKCHHGGPTDDPHGAVIGILRGTKPGINKDSLNCDWSPHSDLHTPAATLATQATEQFFDDIKTGLDSDTALRLLFGVPTLAFAIDTTGSMGDIIDSVRTQAIAIAQSLIGTDDEPGLFVVSPFNDPDTGPVTVTSDFDTFKAAINILTAEGGGDCPELSVTGMQNAVNVMDQDSTLLMFTDAASKDADLAPALWESASAKGIIITIFKYDSDCDDGLSSPTIKLKTREDSQADKVYGEISAATGGQYHTGPRSEVAQISTFLTNIIAANQVAVLRVQSSLAGGSDEFSVPVDSSMTQLTISLLATGLTLTVTKPDGAELLPSTPGATLTTFAGSISVSITSPITGTYKVTVTGVGSYTLSINGVSSLQLSSFNFASVGGRPGHTGWYPLDGPPPYNQQIGAIAEMAGSFQTADFTFRAPTFALITSADMAAGTGDTGYPSTDDFFALLTVPNQSFYVYVAGLDGNGVPYQRVLEVATVPILATTPYPLAGNQTFDLTTNSSSNSNTTSPSSTTSRWLNGTMNTATATATTPPPLYSTSTVLETRVFTITSCAPDVPHCPARVATQTVTIGTTLCPVSLETHTSYATTTYKITACPNMQATCPGKGSVTTKVVPVGSEVVVVPLSTGPGGALSTPTSGHSGSNLVGSSEGSRFNPYTRVGILVMLLAVSIVLCA